VASHLRLSLTLAAGAMLLTYCFRQLCFFGDFGCEQPVAGWPDWMAAGVGAGTFLLLTLPALWPLWSDRSLRRQLRNPGLLPGRMGAEIIPPHLSFVLSITVAAAACLALMFHHVAGNLSTGAFESITLPIAYRATNGLPPEPRMIVNVMRDGTLRINSAVYANLPSGPGGDGPETSADSWSWKQDEGWGWHVAPPAHKPPRRTEEFCALVAREAREHLGADGYSSLAVHIRVDANAPAKSLRVVQDACRRARVYRVYFGVSPRDGYAAAPRAE